MSKIVVQFNPDRTLGGTLSVYKSDGLQEGYGLSALGKAANDTAAINGNAGANQLFPYGDTPSGEYSIIIVTDGTYNGSEHSYGPNGVIKLNPTAGNAATAASNNRVGILIHGGDLGNGGLLRRTNGCVRLMNDEFLYLKGIIENLSISDPVDVVNIYENGTANTPCDLTDTCNDGDPPPGF